MADNQFNYTTYNFDEIRTELENRLKSQSVWKDGAYRSSTGSMLLDLMAAVGTLVGYYNERRAEESYIKTAKNRSSIINLVRLINYNPKRNVSSAGILRFSINDVYSKSIFIPTWTECQTSDGIKFLVASGGVILPGQTYVDVNAIQGELVTISNISTGELNQEYNINDTAVENTHVIVTVGNEVWTQVDSFIDSTTTSKHFIIRPELDGTITIVFGNNIFGKAPDVSSLIQIEYVKSNGSLGNIYTLGSVTTVNTIIYDSDQTAQTVIVTNTSTFLGGSDIETTDQIRYNAPRVFATGDRAVTKSDFIALLEDYPSVANVNVWGEAEETNPDEDNYNRVKISLLLQNWILPDTNLKNTLSTYLYDKSLMTVRYSFIDPTILYVIPVLTIKVAKGNSLSYIQSLVDGALANQFVLGSTTRLGSSVRLSSIYDQINAISGISYCHIDLKLKKILQTGYSSTYTYASTIEAVPLSVGSVDIYVNDVKVGTDDGLGGFTDLSSEYSVSGLVDYTTGFVGVNLSPALGVDDVITVRCSQNQNGDIVVTKNQVCRLSSVVYTDLSYAI